MAVPTERALKRKPQAVVMLKTEKGSVPAVMRDDYDFDWFVTDENRAKFFDQWTAFTDADAVESAPPHLAYLTAEVTDTDKMTLGRVVVSPVNAATKKWKASIEADPSLLTVEPEKKAEREKVVKAPKGARAVKAKADKADAPQPKAAAAKQAAKQDKPSGPDAAKAPQPKAAALRDRLNAAKKVKAPAPAAAKS